MVKFASIYFVIGLFFFVIPKGFAQIRWKMPDSLNQSLPPTLKLYHTNDSLAGKPNIAYYIEADLNDSSLIFDVDTTFKRRLTPSAFYEKNNRPLVLVNGTFFSFKTNQNLNTVIKNGLAVSYNIASVKGSGKDSAEQLAVFRSAIGISGNRKADVAWISSDTSIGPVFASQRPIVPFMIPGRNAPKKELRKIKKIKKSAFKKWEMQTAIGGGPVLLQGGQIAISNNEERLFSGKGINEKHPRTAMGYTATGKLIILVIQGRYENIAEGASLIQTAQLLKDIGCIEALNLDGGGSSCLLVNGKETIKPSDKTGQRATPAVFMIRQK